MSSILLTLLMLFCLYSITFSGDSNDQSVSINGETYSVLEAPSETSSVVEEEMKTILHHLNLKQLTTDLKFFGSYISIAYNGAEEFPLIQGKVRNLIIRLFTLTDKTAVTILELERACLIVLENMEAIHQYLLSNREDVAHEFLTANAGVAEEMAAAANRHVNEYLEVIGHTQELIELAYDTELIAEHSQDYDTVVLESLRSAMGGLLNVAIVMMDANAFWDNMRGHIVHAKRNNIHKEVEFIMKQDKSLERPWKTEYFKGRFVRSYAQWVALSKVFKEFESNIYEVKQDLRAILKQLNPTKEQALENVRRLAKEFTLQLNAAINQIESDSQKRKLNKDEL